MVSLYLPSLALVCRYGVGDAGQGGWMLPTELPLSRLHGLHFQFLSLYPPSLVPVYGCEVGDARQGVWMLLAEHPLSRLHDLHFQFLGLLPPSLVPVWGAFQAATTLNQFKKGVAAT